MKILLLISFCIINVLTAMQQEQIPVHIAKPFDHEYCRESVPVIISADLMHYINITKAEKIASSLDVIKDALKKTRIISGENKILKNNTVVAQGFNYCDCTLLYHTILMHACVNPDTQAYLKKYAQTKNSHPLTESPKKTGDFSIFTPCATFKSHKLVLELCTKKALVLSNNLHTQYNTQQIESIIKQALRNLTMSELQMRLDNGELVVVANAQHKCDITDLYAAMITYALNDQLLTEYFNFPSQENP